MKERFFAGVDVGASATKVAVLDAGGSMVGSAVRPSGVDFEEAGEAAYDSALDGVGVSREDVVFVVSTGYGRKNVKFASGYKTEIACHAKGAYLHYPEEITIADIGGQDNKIIKVGAGGAVKEFKMNRKCAAGTGAFIEEISHRIGVDVEDMERLARLSENDIKIGSFCTVFSVTETLALIRRGTSVADIAKGVFSSVVRRITEMDALEGKIVMTGGVVAHNPIVVDLLSSALGREALTPPHPQLSGAVGAALFAIELSKTLASREK